MPQHLCGFMPGLAHDGVLWNAVQGRLRDQAGPQRMARVLRAVEPSLGAVPLDHQCDNLGGQPARQDSAVPRNGSKNRPAGYSGGTQPSLQRNCFSGS